MWRIIGNESQRAREWTKSTFPGTYPEHERFTALISEYCGDIRGVVFFTDYYPGNSVDIHTYAAVSGRWLTRPFLTAVFEYPFLQLKVRRITGRTSVNNVPVNRFVKACGFTLEGIVREGWWLDESDMLVWGLLKRECRFLGDWTKNGQAVRATSARSDRNGSGSDSIERPNGSGGRGTGTDQPADALRFEHL